MNSNRWIGKSVLRKEDVLLLSGRGTFADDMKFPQLCHAAVLRSPYAHARILAIDTQKALELSGVMGVLTGREVAQMSRPFPVGTPKKMDYFSAAVDRVRYVGEPVAVVVAKNRYLAEDACDLIRVDYEPLLVVVDEEKAMEDDTCLVHEEVGSNIANHRVLTYGDIDQAFAEAEVVLRHKFKFHKYSSTPMETCVVTAKYDKATGVMTIWSNFHGPYSLHSFVAKSLQIPENKLRFIAPPDIGGSFGIKIGITPYLTLIGLAAQKTGRTIRWVEDRREHLMALSSGAERTAYYEMAAKRDGTILGIRSRYVDNNGAYIRAPEPGNLYRTTGNSTGAYKTRNLQIDVYAILTNKSPTGPNRGYGCQQLYFCLERMVDLLAKELHLDPAEIRLRNLIQPEQCPYTTPSGGLFDASDFPGGLRKALEIADYEKLRQQQREARKRGRFLGIGLAVGVEPCVSNMGYLNIAFPPDQRRQNEFHSKSGAGETATVKIDPMGRVTAIVNSAPSGQGHDVLVAQVVAEELDVSPEDVNVVSEMDTFTRFWTISSGNYSSRFASVGLTAFVQASRKLKEKVLAIASHHLKADKDKLSMRDGRIQVDGSADGGMSFRQIAAFAHWNPNSLPEGIEPGLQVTHLFNYSPSKVIDEKDRVNSSNVYGFIAEVVAVDVDPETAEVKILKYVTVHDCGVIINPQRVEGQIYGSVMHGLGGALSEELAYDEQGQFLSASFADYLCPTAMEAPALDIGHVCVPSTFSILGTKGCGEGSAMTAPAAIANAVNDALAPLSVCINQLPLTPSNVWKAMQGGSRMAGDLPARKLFGNLPRSGSGYED